MTGNGVEVLSMGKAPKSMKIQLKDQNLSTPLNFPTLSSRCQANYGTRALCLTPLV